MLFSQSADSGSPVAKFGFWIACLIRCCEKIAAKKLPHKTGRTGFPVSLNSIKSTRNPTLFAVPLASTNLTESTPSQMAVPRRATTNNANHTFGARSLGQIQGAATRAGTMIENQIACTETSALEGGSQPPTPSSKRHNLGIGRLSSWLERKTSPPISAVVRTSFLNTTTFYSQSLQRPRRRISVTSPNSWLNRILPAVSLISSIQETVPQSTQTKCGCAAP